MNDISFGIAPPQPARQPEAVSASLISDDNALDLAPSLARFIAPTMQKLEQTLLLSIELFKGMALNPRNKRRYEPTSIGSSRSRR